MSNLRNVSLAINFSRYPFVISIYNVVAILFLTGYADNYDKSSGKRRFSVHSPVLFLSIGDKRAIALNHFSFTY